jgi:hypothetical protein
MNGRAPETGTDRGQNRKKTPPPAGPIRALDDPAVLAKAARLIRIARARRENNRTTSPE